MVYQGSPTIPLLNSNPTKAISFIFAGTFLFAGASAKHGRKEGYIRPCQLLYCKTPETQRLESQRAVSVCCVGLYLASLFDEATQGAAWCRLEVPKHGRDRRIHVCGSLRESRPPNHYLPRPFCSIAVVAICRVPQQRREACCCWLAVRTGACLVIAVKSAFGKYGAKNSQAIPINDSHDVAFP